MDETPPVTRSALDSALERVGDRWSFLLVEALLEGPLRFTELQARLAEIAPNILIQRLRRLEEQRVLRASPYSDRPLRLAYALTDDGRELAGVLRLLASWGARDGRDAGGSGPDTPAPLRHVACGSALDAQWYCPTCARAIDDDEASALHYA